MEKVLTLEPPEYERYLKNAESPLSPHEVNQPESFAYGVVNIMPTEVLIIYLVLKGLVVWQDIVAVTTGLPRSTASKKDI